MDDDDEEKSSPSRLSVQQKIQKFETPQRSAATYREPQEPASARRRLVGALHVCGQGSMLDESRQPVPIHYVATADIGLKEVRDHRTGETLDPELVKAGREKERTNMKDRGLYDLTLVRESAGKKIRSMWLDEKRVSEDGVVSVRSRCVWPWSSTSSRGWTPTRARHR